ncbi:Lipase_3 domain-containing protein [Meloidogyne graminicola]|uniref:Lipase_3 domain-containing protein n=1 Tax=Meloidogyne graminicola TaxID=189291 RepID=A0A8S9ZL13_9BILA|nr:Lipase_3 domain-containing protein [Meloidogyne graminicola]
MNLLIFLFSQFFYLIFSHLDFEFSSSFDDFTASISFKHNWTVNYGSWLTLPALDFAAAAYSPDPSPCLTKHKANLILRTQVPCDALRDECWAFIAVSRHFIIFSVRGTRTQTQLIIEIIESMAEPKRPFPAGGSVQHYFYESLEAIWNAGFGTKLAELKKPRDLLLITFGQPRVGDIEYAQSHRRLVPNSFRIVHRYDLVPHIPYCYETLKRPHRCTTLHSHGPFHHPTEIWYPAEDMSTNNSLFRICDGFPLGEDQKCSNAHFVHFQVGDHLKYFGKFIDLYGNNGCPYEKIR